MEEESEIGNLRSNSYERELLVVNWEKILENKQTSGKYGETGDKKAVERMLQSS